MARIDIAGGWLTVQITGWDRVLAVRRTVRVPLAHVRGASVQSGWPRGLWKFVRIPGTYIPGVVLAGTYYGWGQGWHFFAIHDPKKSIAIDLTGEFYKRLVVQVEGETPAKAVRRIEAALTPDPSPLVEPRGGPVR